uniref:NADH-ubiquinone oxidoreductase chain 2 n=1 Tax=Microdesmus longipinnis TaxID=166773 RepID=Q94W79_9GOBI|nr:NADH dehydrogenase subunit 2 [Microdesmus longipinnis]
MTLYIMTLLLSTLGLGTTITFASSHWLLAWMGLEINTLAIIPLMTRQHHPRAVEAATKYFLTQATAAATLLFAATTNAWLTGQWDIQLMLHPVPTTMAILALSMKVGLAPLHTWLPEVLQGLDMTTGLILSTWQKLAPFALLLQLPLQNQPLLTLMASPPLLSVDGAGSTNHQLRKVLAYSSIAHLGWMVLVLQFYPTLTALALLLYIFMTSATFLALIVSAATTVNALALSWTTAPLLTTLFPMALLSLGGLPPLSGFMPKWLILQELTKQSLPLTATLAALSALLSLYFYLRLSYAMALTVSPNSASGSASWRYQSSHLLTPLSVLMACSTLLLPLTPALSSSLST